MHPGASGLLDVASSQPGGVRNVPVHWVDPHGRAIASLEARSERATRRKSPSLQSLGCLPWERLRVASGHQSRRALPTLPTLPTTPSARVAASRLVIASAALP